MTVILNPKKKPSIHDVHEGGVQKTQKLGDPN